MRHLKGSTPAERRIIYYLQELEIPFKHRWLIEGREIDFIIGRYAIEIDGKKKQSYEKNDMLIRNGYTPIHLDNKNTKQRSKMKNYLQKLYVN